MAFVTPAAAASVTARVAARPALVGARATAFAGTAVAPPSRRSVVRAAPAAVRMAQTGETLEEFLSGSDPKLAKCVAAMFASCKEVAYKIRTASCDKMACFNDFGDEQLAIDMLADKIIFDNLEASGVVATASSEEVPKEVTITAGAPYSVAFDPLDGSSIIDTNFTVGTIFGVWPGDKLVGTTGRDLVAGGMVLYGPRTTVTLAMDGIDGAHEFLLIDDFSSRHGSWVHTATFTAVNEGKLYAPGNLRAAEDNPGYADLIDYYRKEKFQLRYSGGMVGDVNQILVKGKGVFCNPSSPSAKAKLRLLYEVAPIGYVMEKAGAKSSDGSGSVLDIKVENTEDRSQVCYGSAGEVARFEQMVGKKVEMNATVDTTA